MANDERVPDAHEGREIACLFNQLIYEWRMGRPNEAAKHADALFALGIIVQFRSRPPLEARCRDE